jgi:hypothetical protein
MQCNQAAPAVADQRGFGYARCIEQRPNKICRFFHALGATTLALAMPRQIHREHVVAVMRKVARLQNPHAVIIEHAVDEYERGLGSVEGFAASVAINFVSVDGEVHGGIFGLAIAMHEQLNM